MSDLYANLATDASYNLANHLAALSAINLNSDGTILTSTSALNGPEKDIWMKAHGEEIDRLVESGTGTFIRRNQVPQDKTVAYYNPQLKIKVKNGQLVYRVRGTIGGDQLSYNGTTAAHTAALETIRLLLNAAVSESSNLMTLDIKDFYLGTPLPESQYMRIHLKHIPRDTQIKYGLDKLVINNYVIMRIDRSIYGLKEAGKLSQDQLISHLAKHGYQQATNTPCLFYHTSNGIKFTLVVDDFLVKYNEQAHANHLIKALEEIYTVTTDFSNTLKYVGLTITYDKMNKLIYLSMPDYVKKALARFNSTNLKGANSPILYSPPIYGQQVQVAKDIDPNESPLTPAQVLRLQEIVGVFLYYARAVDPTMLPAINKIGSMQANATTAILPDIERFLNYAKRYPNAILKIQPSDMKLRIHSDASYLSESNARSRAGAYIYLGTHDDKQSPNSAIAYLSVIISTVVDSATSAEYAAAFIAAQAATSLRLTLQDLGYPQDATPIICDNACAVGIANNSFQQKRSKTIDMRYHWLRDQIKLGNFTITWKPGAINLADFFTKAHPVNHHLAMRNVYLHSEEGVLISPISTG